MLTSLFVLFFALLTPQFLFANTALDSYCSKANKTSVGELAAISEKRCEAEKDSKQCQNLYKEIRESGADLSEKILLCDATGVEKVAVSYLGCLAGGWDATLGAAVTGIQSARDAVAKAMQRLKERDQNPDQKANIFQIYNSTRP